MELAYSHEEADSRLFLIYRLLLMKIAMQSSDTDVAVIGVSHCGIVAIDAELLFLIGIHHRKRYNLSRISTISGTAVSFD